MDILQIIQNNWTNCTKQVLIQTDYNVVYIALTNNNYFGYAFNTLICKIIYDYKYDKLIKLINLISSKYKLYISIELNMLAWTKINITPNVYHVCNLEFIIENLSLEHSHKIINLFFLHMPLLTSDDIDSIISYFINKISFLSVHKFDQVMFKRKMNVVMNYIANMDIPLSKQNITGFIRLKIEIPYIHKYGYNMNDSEFLYAYVKSDFYPQSYNIDMDLINEYK